MCTVYQDWWKEYIMFPKYLFFYVCKGGGGNQINVFWKMFQMYKSNVLIMFCFFFHFLRSRVHITTERQLTSSRLSTVTTPTSCWLITGRKENTGRKLSSVEESSAIYISKKFQKVDKDSTCTTTLEHFWSFFIKL